MRKISFSLAAPVGAFFLTLVVSTIALMAFGSSPTEAYGDMLSHASKLETQVDIVNRATPFYLSAVAAAIGFRMNLFNIGVEGQYLMGFLFAAQVGGLVSLPQVLHILVIMLTAMIVSSLYAGLAGILKTTRGVNEVISTIMLNAIAIGGLIAWLQQEWQGDLGENFSSTSLGTKPIDESGLLPTINGLLELVTREVGQGKELTGMFLIAILVGVAYYVLLNRTRFGFDLRASGINPFAARAGGVPPKRMVLAAMMLSGAVAGLIGIAAAPDFTEELIWSSLSDTAKADFQNSGQITFENPYGDDPVIYTYQLIQDGREHLRLQAPLRTPATLFSAACRPEPACTLWRKCPLWGPLGEVTSRKRGHASHG